MRNVLSNLLRWIPLLIIFAVVVGAALLAAMAQDRANPRPTRTTVRAMTKEATAKPTEMIFQPAAIQTALSPVGRCIVTRAMQTMAPTRTPVSTGISRRMKVGLIGEYLCAETDGTVVTQIFTFMAFYDALLNDPTAQCPQKVYSGLYELKWGSCQTMGNPQ